MSYRFKEIINNVDAKTSLFKQKKKFLATALREMVEADIELIEQEDSPVLFPKAVCEKNGLDYRSFILSMDSDSSFYSRNLKNI